MTFAHINRRVHLYLGLGLLPWFFMYGVSSLPFAHNQFFEQRDRAKGLPLWTLRSERSVDVPIPEDAKDLRRFGALLLEPRDELTDPHERAGYRPSRKARPMKSLARVPGCLTR